MRYGPVEGRRLPHSSTCETRFPERKGTPLFDARLPTATANATSAHAAEGVDTLKTGRLSDVHPDTVASPHDERSPVR